MNRTALKNYAPQARRAFIQATTDRAAYYGLAPGKTEPVIQKGDVAVIAGREHARAVAGTRKQLEERIKRYGFEPTIEAIAYTWFNRLVAIRFMELHGYLEHGYRVLSHPEGKPGPEILEQAEHAALPGLKHDVVIDLKLAGNKEGELYRLLLTAQCNALHAAMPFLFERIDDETELLLPDNLLHSDSLIRKLVSEIDEQDWQQVEIIGWLYEFYISEKYDEVIGKVVASEDIPAATQRFTPNWVVKYLTQNTVGRQWLATYPQSALRQRMEHYIEPAEQTPEVLEQLEAITPTNLNPEEMTLLDPACGSGHILVEAYDLFKAIYQERGYRARDIPALILQKNLFGLEIDDRAAQLASFALMMKARADDRRIFDSDAKPNILAFEDSQGMDASDITHALNSPINKDDIPSKYLVEEIQDDKDGLFNKKALAEKAHVSQVDITSLLDLFENAKTFGSLIQVPPKLSAKLPEIEKRLDYVLKWGDLTHAAAHVIKSLLHQARLLARQYDAVVANPPYMGSKFYSATLKAFVNQEYKEMKGDLYACFMERNRRLTEAYGFHGMINIPNWMFLSSFEDMRKSIFRKQTFDSFVHNGRGVFGSDFGSCMFVLREAQLPDYRGSYRRLFEKQGSVASNEILEKRFHTAATFTLPNADFGKIPGSPVAYWVSAGIVRAFQTRKLRDLGITRRGLQPGDVVKHVRFWPECSSEKTSDLTIQREKKWFPFNSGGEYRKWFGNISRLVNWEADGRDIKSGHNPIVPSEELYFQEAVTWSKVSIGKPSFRYQPEGVIPGDAGPCFFSKSNILSILAFLNSDVARILLDAINPTVNMQVGDLANLPVPEANILRRAEAIAANAVELARQDWDSFETSWDFQNLPVLQEKKSNIRLSQEAADSSCLARFVRMKELEEENNLLFIEAYKLQDEISHGVPDDQITLYRPECEEDTKRLISYSIGCMMGRYSLDKQGLIYARSRNLGFDSSLYETFRADDDGILPLLPTNWRMRDDAADRLVDFVNVVWPKGQLEENLKFIADRLAPTNDEQPRDTIRRYLATGFYKHHLSMYKRRPIYWLFSSGKQRAFQCLVYLHRYHEGTLARMRTDYVIPLQGQIAARIEQLEADKAKAASTSHRNRLQKEQTNLKKQQAELLIFEEKLKHVADQKIALDLDDGVKANYAKFGDLLAEAKAITGGKDDE